MNHVLVAGLCRHVYHGHTQGLAASFTQDQLAMLHNCLPEGCIAYAEEDVQVMLAVSCCGALSSKISSCVHQHTSCWHITYLTLCVLYYDYFMHGHFKSDLSVMMTIRQRSHPAPCRILPLNTENGVSPDAYTKLLHSVPLIHIAHTVTTYSHSHSNTVFVTCDQPPVRYQYKITELTMKLNNT